MHILILGPFPPPEGGVARNIAAIRRYLIRENHQCTVICTTRNTSAHQTGGVITPANAIEFLQHMLKTTADIIHLHIGGRINWRVYALLGICILFGRRRSVLTIHSGEFGISKKHNVFFLRYLLKQFCLIIAVNEQISSVLESLGVKPDKIRVISPFVLPFIERVEVPHDLMEFVDARSPLIVSVGLLEPEYDLEIQLAAIQSLIKIYPKIGLMIIGSGSLEAHLVSLIKQKNLESYVKITGDLPHVITLQMISSANVLLRTTRFDGDAISVREALFLGTPVIATDNGMRPEGVITITTPADTVNLTSAIEKLFQQDSSTVPVKNDTDIDNIEIVLSLYKQIYQKIANFARRAPVK